MLLLAVADTRSTSELSVCVFMCAHVQVLSCNTSTCINVLICVIVCVFRLPPSGSCVYLAKTRDRHKISPHLLPREVLHSPGNYTVNAVSTPHPMQQPQSPADTNEPFHNFIPLLPTLVPYAQFLVSAPVFYSLQLSQVCYWLPPKMV